MAEANIPKFIFYRTNEVVKHGGVKGNRGILQVNGTLYFTIERDIERFVEIPTGTYTLKMEYSPTRTVPTNIYPFINGVQLPRRQFRIMGHNVRGEHGGLANLLIHQGQYPGGLTGCIAPGKMMIPGGVDQSSIAMTELFNACGGFQEKANAAILEVVMKPIFQNPIGSYPTF